MSEGAPHSLLLAVEVVPTTSGAWAIRDRITGEVMHPVVGPRVECESLYVQPSRLRERLCESEQDSLVLLDVGLGAGSNAALAWRVAEEQHPAGRHLEIVSFDRSLDALRVACASDQREELGLTPAVVDAATKMMVQESVTSSRVSWRLVLGELPDTLRAIPDASADIVFWDPFSPRSNPSLWTMATFAELRRVCRAGATIHTYSGATAVRSALLLAGFAVGEGLRLGEYKRATVAATELASLSEPLDRRWLERLSRSGAAWPMDAPSDALDRIRQLPQFSAR